MTSSHSKSEYKNLTTAVKQKFAQRGRTNRHASAVVDSEKVLKRDEAWRAVSSGGGDDDLDRILVSTGL